MADEGQEMQQQQEVVTQESLDVAPKTLYHAIKGNNPDAVQKLIEDGEDVNVRGMDGKTLLHLAVSVNAEPKIFTALLEKVDDFGMSQRDENGDSVLEMIYNNDYAQEAEDAIKERVKQIILKGDVGKLKSLVNSGWTMLSCFDDLKESEDLAEKKELLEKLFIFKDKVDAVHKGIHDSDMAILGLIKEDQELSIACDRTGLPPLIKAIILGKSNLAQEIAKQFSDSLNAKDNLGRVALHYAAVASLEEDIYQLLLDAGAEDIEDKEGKTAADYKESPELLDLSKVQQRIQDILIKSPVTGRVKKQTENESDSEARENKEDQNENADGDKKEEEEQDPKDENQGEEPEEIFKEMPDKELRAGPSSYEGQYLATTLGPALTKALAEIAECRPWDPIEYLAHFLYKYHADMNYIQHQKEILDEIKAENEEKEQNRILREKRKEEEREIKGEEIRRQKEEEEKEERQRLELEEQQKKAKEASLAHPPDLPTVKEEDIGEVEESVVREKDENGQTELHKLAGEEGADLMPLLDAGYSLADRDAKYRTPRDIAEENSLDDNVETFDSYLTGMIEGDKLEELQRLMLEGYDKFSSVLEKVSTDGLPEKVITFTSGIPEFQGKIKDLIKAVRSGDRRHVSQTLTRKSFALAKDNMGRTLLHNAVLYDHREVTEYIATTYPSSLTARDTLNRTPVHYAAGLSEELFDLLVENGGSLIIKDARGKTPGDYKEDNGEITALRDEAPGIELTEPDHAEEEGEKDANGEENEADKDENAENNDATKDPETAQS